MSHNHLMHVQQQWCVVRTCVSACCVRQLEQEPVAGAPQLVPFQALHPVQLAQGTPQPSRHSACPMGSPRSFRWFWLGMARE